MMCVAPIRAWNRLLQTLLHLERRGADRKAQAVRHAEYMCIHGDGRRMKGNAHHHIRRLASDARELLQRLKVRRHLAAVIIQQNMAGLYDVLRLHAEKPTVMNLRFECGLSERGHRSRRICLWKEPPRHHIDARIRTLCRKNHRNEELERRLKCERGLCIRIEGPQNAQLLRLNCLRDAHQFVRARVGAGIRPPRAMKAAELKALRTGTMGE